MASCFVYKVISDLLSIDHLYINPIHTSDLSISVSSSEVYKSVLLCICKQGITPLSLLVGTTVN